MNSNNIPQNHSKNQISNQRAYSKNYNQSTVQGAAGVALRNLHGNNNNFNNKNSAANQSSSQPPKSYNFNSIATGNQQKGSYVVPRGINSRGDQQKQKEQWNQGLGSAESETSFDFNNNSGSSPGKNSSLKPQFNLSGQQPSEIQKKLGSSSQQDDKQLLQSEFERLQEKLQKMERNMQEKDKTIEKQRTEIASLRSKNFEFRSKITDLEDKLKQKPQQSQSPGTGVDEIRLAMQIQQQEMRQRERELMIQVMMNSMIGGGVEQEEERLLQRAIEESKANCPVELQDNMSYEQLLELEQRNGKVSKGLKPSEIRLIPEKVWNRKTDSTEETCSICFENFEKGQKMRNLKRCHHEYHTKCIDQWLQNEKRCPVCNEDVL